MKRIAAIILLGAGVVGMQPHHADFSGKWVMNIKKSKNLPPSFKNLDSYSMRVQESGDSMTVLVEFAGSGQKVELPPTV